MKIILIISLLIFTLLPLCVISQPVSSSDDIDYIIEDFNLPGGRLGNNVNAIAEGPNGFLWFGSHGGLHRFDGYEFKTFRNDPLDTLEETTSLKHDYIENLYWDSKGFLWVATYGGGIFMFNPKTEVFKHFKHISDDSTTISHPRVISVVEDTQGNIWIGTEIGLNKLDRSTQKVTRYYADGNTGSLLNDDIRDLYVDKSGTLWAGTGFIYFDQSKGALSKYDPENDLFENYIVKDPDELDNTPDQSPIRGLLEDKEGNFWVGSGKGLYKMNREEGSFKYMTYNPESPYAAGTDDRVLPSVNSIMEDNNGAIWIGSILDYSYPSHLVRYDPVKGETQSFPVSTAAWCLGETSDGVIWVGGAGDTGNVLRIKPKDRSFDLLNGDHAFLQFSYSIVSDGIKRGYRLFGPVNMVVSNENKIWSTFVLSNIEDQPDSSIAVFAEYDMQSRTYNFDIVEEIDLNGNVTLEGNLFGARGMAIDQQGIIWTTFATENTGIISYNPKTKEVENFLHDPDDSTSIPSNFITSLMLDSRQELWVTTHDQGIFRWNTKSGEIVKYDLSSGFFDENDVPMTSMEDPDGKVWIAGEIYVKDGTFRILVYDPQLDKFDHIKLADSRSFGTISNIAQSPITKKVMFTLVNNGIGVYDPTKNSIEYYNTSNGLFPYDEVSSIVCDQDGVFWIAQGDLGRYIQINSDFEIISFDESTSSDVLWRSGILGSNGNVYFSTYPRGWVEINPDEIDFGAEIGGNNMNIVSFSVNGLEQGIDNISSEPIWDWDYVELEHNANSFSVQFTDFNYTGSRPNFQYRLIPYDSTWQRNPISTKANFYKIPPGNYTLQVKSFRFGVLHRESKELAINILPPWYMTWWAYVGYVIIFALGVFGVHTVQKDRTIRKEREKIKDRELAQAKEVEKAYEELKSTQKQLIHSEKMASLGELTAGIAHEIQNPLNFVNNFSDVNSELVGELKEEIDQGNLDEAKSIADSIEENEKKIVHHGKRAEDIVKSMLQHSRGSSGEKIDTDINELADEYLRLAFHGMRAKDKSFNASMNTDFDDKIGMVNVVPQDIGRVILNLITNAFYAVSERSKNLGNGYQPEVDVSTTIKNDNVVIRVSDNGTGITQENIQKIFEPFFSTKEVGKGTGLGLSLSYDIVTKGHNGKIEVESEPGNGSEFIVTLPKNPF